MERLSAELCAEIHRVVARQLFCGHQQVGSTVAIGIDQLHAGVGQMQPCRDFKNGFGLGELAAAQVSPIARRRAKLQDVRQAMSEQVDQRQIGVGQARHGQGGSLHRKELAFRGLESRVVEVERRQFPGRPAVIAIADDVDAAEERGGV